VVGREFTEKPGLPGRKSMDLSGVNT